MAKSGNQKGKLLYLAEIFHRETDEAHGLTLAELTAEEAHFLLQPFHAFQHMMNGVNAFHIDG